LTIADKDGAAKIKKKDEDHKAKWTEDLADETKEAKALEEKVKLAEHRADYYDLGEALLEIGLVITSVTLLTRKPAYWYAGIVASIVGVVAVVSGLLLK